MGTQVLGLLLMSWFVGVTANMNALYTVILATVILATVAFTVLAYSGGSFSGKSSYARATDAGYWIACPVVMIICEGVIRHM